MSSETKLSYIAGFIDADGCIMMNKAKKTFRPRINISNTNKGALEKIKDILEEIGVGYVGFYLSGNTKQADKNGWKRGYCLEIRRLDDVKLLISKIYPYMIGKKKQAMQILDFLNGFSSAEDSRLIIKYLNKKGRKWQQ